MDNPADGEQLRPDANDVPDKEGRIEGADPDLGEVVGVSRQAADDVKADIGADAEKVKGQVYDEQGSGAGIVSDLEDLQGDVREGQVAFEARAKRLSSPYVMSPELSQVLETARTLGKPLLLEGEPGTGKTTLAYALAGEHNMPIIHAQCRSTTNAQDMLYTYDVVRRLQDSQLGEDVSDQRRYIDYGPLGKAFSSEEPSILLVDEIDKAKREFPNDLLHEMDGLSFIINETGQEITAKHPPIIIITSNHEKDLPEPFLRRAIYHYIEFPSPEQMTEIVRAHLPDVADRLLESAIERFYEVREVDGLEKKPSTSEMLDWIKILQAEGIEEITGTPFPEVLLKIKGDQDKLAEPIHDSEQAEHQSRVPIEEQLRAVREGKKVVTINTETSTYPSGAVKEPVRELCTALANAGFRFTNLDRYGTEKPKALEIHSPGITRGKSRGLTFVIDQKEETTDKGLYDILVDGDYGESELVELAEPASFASIIESNEAYTMGRDRDGNTIYRTADGRWFKEDNWHDEEENDGDEDTDADTTTRHFDPFKDE